MAKMEARLETVQSVLEEERADRGAALGEVQLEMKRQVSLVTTKLEDVKKTDKEIINNVRVTQKQELEKVRRDLFAEQQFVQELKAEIKREQLASHSRAKTIETLSGKLATAESQLEVGKQQVLQLSSMLARSGMKGGGGGRR